MEEIEGDGEEFDFAKRKKKKRLKEWKLKRDHQHKRNSIRQKKLSGTGAQEWNNLPYVYSYVAILRG